MHMAVKAPFVTVMVASLMWPDSALMEKCLMNHHKPLGGRVESVD